MINFQLYFGLLVWAKQLLGGNYLLLCVKYRKSQVEEFWILHVHGYLIHCSGKTAIELQMRMSIRSFCHIPCIWGYACLSREKWE